MNKADNIHKKRNKDIKQNYGQVNYIFLLYPIFNRDQWKNQHIYMQLKKVIKLYKMKSIDLDKNNFL